MDSRTDPSTPATITLKKYGNRRLYDTSSSRYVTLAEVEAMVQQGKDIIVVDAKTGADLTKEVMVQLILDGDGARAALPTGLLKQAIRLAHSPLKDGLVRAVQEGLDGFLSSQRAVVDAQRALMGQMAQLGQLPWVPPSASGAPMWNPFAGMTPPPAQPALSPASAPSDLDSLKAELHETQALVRKLVEREVARSEPAPAAATTKAPVKKAKAKAKAKKK
ncbi:MAG: polyhydroxyalkanoate synthesis regulator DNA-binding domain-containing protein [Deltaproteobacteria bacterium]|nr:polyhydroxyalkanoate synthesis regulator DNA-binding domain-containing protein [Deltaproteobacteria bacterium]